MFVVAWSAVAAYVARTKGFMAGLATIFLVGYGIIFIVVVTGAQLP
jgi:hypothetical protein